MAMPSKTALLGMLAVAGFKHRHRIADFLRDLSDKDSVRKNEAAQAADTPQEKSFLSDVQSSLASGGLGSLLSTGLKEIVGDFSASGREDKARSWVGKDANEAITENDLEAALDPATLADLEHSTGLNRQALLERLAVALPEAVDRLTPGGEIPDEDDAYRAVA